jgi:hypothetical protein
MIEAIEAVLKHWGEFVRCGAPSGGLGSPAGTLVEWKGCPPRTGAAGSRVLLAGAGPDVLADEVGAALAAIERGEGGEVLGLLARLRYTYEPALAKSAQVRDLNLGHGEAGLKAYTRLVQRLHQAMQAELQARNGRMANQQREAKRAGDRMRKASLQQAAKAHAARGAELHKRDRSSGDSAPVGAVAPRQAPVRNNR